MTFEQSLRTYFTSFAQTPGEVAWRMQCYATGRELMKVVRKRFETARPEFSFAQLRVLDLSCGWGGHALAFAEAGAAVTGGDLNDHNFDGLRSFVSQHHLKMEVLTADCQNTPYQEQYDVILALDLIEHIPSPDKLANEVRRLLRSDGICILTTPAKFLSVFWREPHWQLRGLSLLPFRLQRPVAQHLFKRSYPFPIEHQYWRVGQLRRVFRGMQCTPIAASRKLPWASLFWGRIEITH
jgi:SAM-dependent methyltransferase